jgi:hypothetical protein
LVIEVICIGCERVLFVYIGKSSLGNINEPQTPLPLEKYYIIMTPVNIDNILYSRENIINSITLNVPEDPLIRVKYYINKFSGVADTVYVTEYRVIVYSNKDEVVGSYTEYESFEDAVNVEYIDKDSLWAVRDAFDGLNDGGHPVDTDKMEQELLYEITLPVENTTLSIYSTTNNKEFIVKCNESDPYYTTNHTLLDDTEENTIRYNVLKIKSISIVNQENLDLLLSIISEVYDKDMASARINVASSL